MQTDSVAAPTRRALRWAAAAGVAIVVLVAAVVGGVYAFMPRAPLAPDFTLTDQFGQPFTLSRQRGRAVVLFFGYTHCPDVCPTTLSALARAKRLLGPRAQEVTVAFVTVDAERDSRNVVGRYVKLFDPTFVGLTGSPAQLETVYREYHVFHQKLPTKSALGYLVAHSSSIEFIGTDGRVRGTGDWGDSTQQLATDMKEATA